MNSNKKTIILFTISIFGLLSCNAGSAPQNQTTAPPIIQQPISDGPLNGNMFTSALSSTPPNSLAGKLVHADYAEMGVIANLNPYAAIAYKSINIAAGVFKKPTPIASTNQIYAVELNISNQITALQTQMSTDQNIIYSWYQDQVNNKSNQAINTYNSQLSSINLLYNHYLSSVLMVTPTNPTGYSLESVPTAGVTYYYATLPNSVTGSVLQSYMTNFTNSQCTGTLPTTNWQGVINESSEISGSMATMLPFNNTSTSNLVALLQALQAQLVLNIHQPNEADQNIVPLISQYNQTLEYVYESSLVALTQAYMIEASGNYFQMSNQYNSTFPYAGNIPFDDCSYSNYNSTEATYLSFGASQAFLTQLYVDRINSLYKTINHFIISDAPMLPLNALQQGYESILFGTTPAKTLYNPGTQESIVGGWQANGLLYQEPTILAYKECINAMATSKSTVTLNSNNCQSLMPNMNNGYYDNESISAYMVSNGAYILSQFDSTTPFNFESYCNVESGINMVLANSTTTAPGLVCNNWSGPAMANSSTVNANLDVSTTLGSGDAGEFLYQPKYLNMGGCKYTAKGHYDNFVQYQMSCNSNYDAEEPWWGMTNWYDMAHQYQDSYTYYVANSSLGSNNFTLLASSTQNVGVPSFNLGSGEFYTSGSGTSFALQDGGFNPSYAYTHSALLQVTLPNGYNLPFYVFSYTESSKETYSTPLCPSALGVNPPGIIACTQQSAGNGGFEVTTADGSTYYLNVLQPPSGQGMQYGYLQIASSPQQLCSGSICSSSS